MTTPNHRTAAAALDAARPLVARLDATRHPEELAADLIEGWAGVETALRALLGGSALAGQPLVSEARSRGLLEYAHVPALLGFLAARDRATRPDHHPTGDDVDAARSGFQAMESAVGLGGGTEGSLARSAPSVGPPVGAASRATSGQPLLPVPGLGGGPVPPRAGPPPAAATGGGTLEIPLERRPTRSRLPLLVGALALLLAAVGGWWAWSAGAGERALDRGIAAYRDGRREIARREFQAAAADDPRLARARVYLARLARDEGDLARANTELQAAIRLDPRDGLAQREMGALMLQTNQPQLATNFFRRALEVDPDDRVASGWMGCALARQGRGDLAANFFRRAGQGDWTTCERGAGGLPVGIGGVAPGTPGSLPVTPPTARNLPAPVAPF